MLLGAGGLVIGAVIAVSNDTLSWLPLARPQKAGSVHLSLQGGGGSPAPWQLLSYHLPCTGGETEARRFGSTAALAESWAPRGRGTGWATSNVLRQTGEER